MSDTLTVEIPAEVKDNSETVTDYAFMRNRAQTDWPYHTISTRDAEIRRVSVFPSLALTHYQWTNVNPDGQRCRFDMITDRDGVVVNLYHTEYFTRVGCQPCKKYRAQSYASYYVVQDYGNGPTDAVPFCDEHLRELHRFATDGTLTLSEPLLIG